MTFGEKKIAVLAECERLCPAPCSEWDNGLFRITAWQSQWPQTWELYTKTRSGEWLAVATFDFPSSYRCPYSDRALDMFSFVLGMNNPAPQPVCVTVPPIEWEPMNAVGTYWGKGKDDMFSIKRRGTDFIAGYASMTHKTPFKTFEEANAVCYGMKKDVVDRALEGCKIEPFRDPQGLVDALESIIATDAPEWNSETFRQNKYHRIAASNAIKEWEDGK